MLENQKYPVAIIGGGPIGLAAAAHLSERNILFRLYEAGPGVGANVQHWQHVRLFSPWQYNIDAAAARLLQQAGWQQPHLHRLPTGAELIAEYLAPLAALPSIQPFIFTNSRVLSIVRKGYDKTRTAGRSKAPFVLRVMQQDNVKHVKAAAIIDASGTWQNPNPIGAGGLPAIGEADLQEYLFYGIPDIQGSHKNRYAGKNVMVVGSGHSAINSLLELSALKKEYPLTRIHWALVSQNLQKVFGGKDKDQLEARGALGRQIEALVNKGDLQLHYPFHIEKLSSTYGKLKVEGTRLGQPYQVEGIDEIIANTGARPDLTISREIRVVHDEILECVPLLRTLIDPNLHSCGTVRPHGELELRQPEENYYIIGMKSYGRAPSFLMATGYEQVRSVVAYLTGDLEASRKVALSLPETGVCSLSPSATDAECCSSEKTVATATTVKQAASCCGGPASTNTDACCQQDEEAKVQGQDGCGCTSQSQAGLIPSSHEAALAKACCTKEMAEKTGACC